MIEATEEYALAHKQGQKEYKEMLSQNKEPHPAVLDYLLGEQSG